MKNRRLQDSFKNAFNGIFQAFKTERNVKLHFASGICAVLGAYLLDFTLVEWVLILITICMVIVAELLNTAIEYTVDMVMGDKYHELAKYAKDIAAGATLITAIFSIFIAGILYLPKLLQFF